MPRIDGGHSTVRVRNDTFPSHEIRSLAVDPSLAKEKLRTRPVNCDGGECWGAMKGLLETCCCRGAYSAAARLRCPSRTPWPLMWMQPYE